MKASLLPVLCLAIISAGCAGYSSVREIQPAHRSPTSSGKVITQSLNKSTAQPLKQIGGLLDAASSAASLLENQPADRQALEDYNFAVSRIFGIIHRAGLEPWQKPLACPGAARTWNFSINGDSKPGRDPADFDIRPADTLRFRGSLVSERVLKEGIGAPLVVESKAAEPGKIEKFEVRRISYGMTGVVKFDGSNCTGSFFDPLAVEDIPFAGHTHPLAADFTAPLALALASQDTRRKELGGLFRPSEFEEQARLALLQPYDPERIPVLCIHGLGDSQATWAPLIQTLRADPIIRKNYQFWFFSYPTGFPYPLSASVLRRRLDAINKHHPDHQKIVVIGHSMGGMIARTLITDSGMELWNAIYDQPPAEIPFSPETRKVMSESLIFKPRPDISRVIFASASHRGSNIASNFLGRLGSRIIGAPADLLPDEPEVLTLARPNTTGANLRRMPNSIDFLKPENRFVSTLATLPTAPGIPYHSIIGDRGRGGNLDHRWRVSTDGIVPYWSSHLAGAQSELIIPSHHWTNQHPQGIAETGRILREHLKNP
jgi:pimeloyl-ACP methyl ester carboxylesterase